MDLIKLEEAIFLKNDTEVVGIFRDFFTILKNDINELQGKLEDGENKIFEIYQPIMDKALSLSDNSEISRAERQEYFLTAKTIAEKLSEYQQRINDRNLKEKKERQKAAVVGAVAFGVVIAMPYIKKFWDIVFNKKI